MTDWYELTVPEKCELVRATISPLDIADQAGLEVHGGKIRSPFNPDERTPSCHLYEDGWYDFSTGRGGDVIDLVQALHGYSIGRALDALGRLMLNEDWDAGRVRQHEPAEPPDMRPKWAVEHRPADVSVWSEKLPPIKASTLDWLNRNGYIGHFSLAKTELAVPHWHDGKVTGIKLRGLDGAKSAVPGSTFACGLYRPHEVTNGRTLVIAEGESDSWALVQSFGEGQVAPVTDVMALPSGAGTWKDRWLDELAHYELIYTAFDNDRAGQAATEKVRKAIGWERWRELKVPTLFNDVREAMAAGWEPALKEIA